ncbi:MAG: hypothetical protein NT004_10710 [Bacteroidetes bacterium]|nr:hypothetical protein [Bacteroidota bacterium]
MKKSLKVTIFTMFIFTLMAFSQIGFSQSPPPPPGEKGGNTNQAPLGAPIDGGLTIFLLFAAGYSAREWVKGGNNKKELLGN